MLINQVSDDLICLILIGIFLYDVIFYFLLFILLLLILSLLFSRFLLRFYCLPCFLLPCLVLTVSARAQRVLWPLTRSFALCRPATPPGYLNFYRLCSYQLYFYRLIFTALFLPPYFYRLIFTVLFLPHYFHRLIFTVFSAVLWCVFDQGCNDDHRPQPLTHPTRSSKGPPLKQIILVMYTVCIKKQLLARAMTGRPIRPSSAKASAPGLYCKDLVG